MMFDGSPNKLGTSRAAGTAKIYGVTADSGDRCGVVEIPWFRVGALRLYLKPNEPTVSYSTVPILIQDLKVMSSGHSSGFL